MKKRYTLLDNKRYSYTNYSKLGWECSWFFVWISGVVLGFSIGYTFF